MASEAAAPAAATADSPRQAQLMTPTAAPPHPPPATPRHAASTLPWQTKKFTASHRGSCSHSLELVASIGFVSRINFTGVPNERLVLVGCGMRSLLAGGEIGSSSVGWLSDGWDTTQGLHPKKPCATSIAFFAMGGRPRTSTSQTNLCPLTTVHCSLFCPVPHPRRVLVFAARVGNHKPQSAFR
jgi:hypothetical protein